MIEAGGLEAVASYQKDSENSGSTVSHFYAQVISACYARSTIEKYLPTVPGMSFRFPFPSLDIHNLSIKVNYDDANVERARPSGGSPPLRAPLNLHLFRDGKRFNGLGVSAAAARYEDEPTFM